MCCNLLIQQCLLALSIRTDAALGFPEASRMRMRFAWATLALLVLSCLAPALRAAEEVKKPEAKEELLSPALRIDYATPADVAQAEPNNKPAQANPLGSGNTF